MSKPLPKAAIIELTTAATSTPGILDNFCRSPGGLQQGSKAEQSFLHNH